MDILTVSNMYPSRKDPAYGTFVRNFYESIRSRNPEGKNHLVTIRGRRKNKASKLCTYISFYVRLTWRLLFGRYDLIYIHTITFPILPVRIALWFRSLPLAFNVHGDDLLPKGKLKRWLKHLACKPLLDAKMVVSPSSYYKKVLLEEFPALSPERIFISPSGGVAQRFFDAARERNAREEKNPVIGFVSRYAPGKGWDTYLEALYRLRKKGHRFKAVMAGGGPGTEKVAQMIARLGLEDIVTELGAVSQERLPELYASFDLFIFPTRLNESLGLVGIEALATATPVIASNMAGPTTYVRDGVNGFLFTPGSVDALVSAIGKYLALSPQAKRDMSKAAADSALPYEATRVAGNMYVRLCQLVGAD